MTRIVMIGSGGIAERHLATLAAMPEVRIVGHVARTRASSERAAARWGGRSHADVAGLLAAEEPDAAWITVPPDAHEGIETRLIDAGVPFLVEKPLSADRGTAVAIGERLRGAGVTAAVGYQWRAMDTLGEVRRVLADHPVRMVLGAWHGTLPEPTWWRSRARSGGQIVEQATHVVDLARHLLGGAEVLHAAEAHRDRPEADVAGVAAAVVRFASGPLATFTASNVAGTTLDVSLRLICDDLGITITRDEAIFEDARGRLLLRRREDPIATQNRAFLDAVRDGDPGLVVCSYDDALATHRLVFDMADACHANDPDARGTDGAPAPD